MKPHPVFRYCVECATYGLPVGGLHFRRPTYVGPEIDQWLEPPVSWEVMSLLRSGMSEDFTLLSEEGQRMFLVLAAEVLYGSEADPCLRDECARIAREPI